MSDIKIYVTCDKQVPYIPQNALLYPIQAGAALAENRFPDMLHDDDGENISAKNRCYCELTAQYYAWKNEDADYYGFFHYRRYLSFSKDRKMKEDGWGNVLCDSLDADSIARFGLDEHSMRELIERYDVIAPARRQIYAREDGKKREQSIYEQYAQAYAQHEEDLSHLLDVLGEKYPQYVDDAIAYVNGCHAYECNMYVMRREIFLDYMGWLFDILFETKRRLKDRRYSAEENRAIAFLAERACGIYIYHLIKDGRYRVYEAQKILIRNPQRGLPVRPVRNGAVPVVLSTNRSFVPYMSVFLISLMENKAADTVLDILILHEDVDEELQGLLLSMRADRADVSIRFLDVGDVFNFSDLFTDQHISKETYFRFAIVDLLTEYNRVLYLDGDMVVNSDLRELYETDLQGAVIAAVRDVDFSGGCRMDEKLCDYARGILHMERYADYFQAGVLVLDLERIRRRYCADELLAIASMQNWLYWDQDVLNYAFKGNCRYLPQEWNVLMNWKEADACRIDRIKKTEHELFAEYMKARKAPKIIHYAGYQKPWQYPTCDYGEVFWRYARQTPFYEKILLEMSVKNIALSPQGDPGAVSDRYAQMQADPENHEMAIKIVEKLDRMLPQGSRRRKLARAFGRKWLHVKS